MKVQSPFIGYLDVLYMPSFPALNMSSFHEINFRNRSSISSGILHEKFGLGAVQGLNTLNSGKETFKPWQYFKGSTIP